MHKNNHKKNIAITISDEDRTLFREAMGNEPKKMAASDKILSDERARTQEKISEKNILSEKVPVHFQKIKKYETEEKAPVHSHSKIHHQNPSESFYLSDYITENLTPEENVNYFSEGAVLEPKVLKQIKQGAYPINQTIDLHGDTIESARNVLIQSMQKAEERQWRCLLIIHGKGHHAKLKSHLVHWLKQLPRVLFFCSAEPKDGGSGALYVFLKKNKMILNDAKVNLSNTNTLNTHLNNHLKQDLNEIRGKIDQLDHEIIKLLCQRLACAKQAGSLKKTSAQDVKREQEILTRLGEQGETLGYSKKYIKRIYQEVLIQMREYQRDEF